MIAIQHINIIICDKFSTSVNGGDLIEVVSFPPSLQRNKKLRVLISRRI